MKNEKKINFNIRWRINDHWSIDSYIDCTFFDHAGNVLRSTIQNLDQL